MEIFEWRLQLMISVAAETALLPLAAHLLPLATAVCILIEKLPMEDFKGQWKKRAFFFHRFTFTRHRHRIYLPPTLPNVHNHGDPFLCSIRFLTFCEDAAAVFSDHQTLKERTKSLVTSRASLPGIQFPNDIIKQTNCQLRILMLQQINRLRQYKLAIIV